MVPDRFGAGARRRWPTRLGRWGYLGVGHRLRSLPVRAELSRCKNHGPGTRHPGSHLGCAESDRLKRVTGDIGMAAAHLRHQTNRSFLAAQAPGDWTSSRGLIAAAADRPNDRSLDGV